MQNKNSAKKTVERTGQTGKNQTASKEWSTPETFRENVIKRIPLVVRLDKKDL